MAVVHFSLSHMSDSKQPKQWRIAKSCCCSPLLLFILAEDEAATPPSKASRDSWCVLSLSKAMQSTFAGSYSRERLQQLQAPGVACSASL